MIVFYGRVLKFTEVIVESLLRDSESWQALVGDPLQSFRAFNTPNHQVGYNNGYVDRSANATIVPAKLS